MTGDSYQIPLIITTPEQVSDWSGERRSTALLLDATESGFFDDVRGWLEVVSADRARSGFMAVSAGPSPVRAGHAVGKMRASHGTACTCCVVRAPVAAQMLALFQARARGLRGFFRSIVLVVSPGQVTAVEASLQADSPVLSLFKIQAER
ncbi:hypothetical protein [Acetobacter oeni]|uniref:Uncharacterized protein n=1 Tax=Acetobacter oeni TaxID=304077 RepID=A0A511XK59_9PROT|nr:hypothetical protein [Acetobacter oeni]MBB3883138.1 hypothetical protein [Acetobacter oeni]NHO19222.1 hypothetical protein [Acetobacter oeni]GEN63319.1 hypothetical protein AOE01nite_15430 [Acetobacter oeni]